MTNIATCLLALTLTGAPVAGLICIADCRQAPATPGPCHETGEASEEPAISAAFGCSDPFIAQTVYVVEHRVMARAAVLTQPWSLTTPAVVETTAPGLLPGSTSPWLKPRLVLRI